MLQEGTTTKTTKQNNNKIIPIPVLMSSWYKVLPNEHHHVFVLGNENVLITSLLVSLFMQCNGNCGHPFIDARSEVMNTFSLALLKEATINQYFCHRNKKFTTHNQPYLISNYKFLSHITVAHWDMSYDYVLPFHREYT